MARRALFLNTNEFNLNRTQLSQLMHFMSRFDRENRGRRTTPPAVGSNEESAAQNGRIERYSVPQGTDFEGLSELETECYLRNVIFEECETCLRTFMHVDKFREIEVVCEDCEIIFDTFNTLFPPVSCSYAVEITKQKRECRLCFIKVAISKLFDNTCEACDDIVELQKRLV